ncbi:UNVERIFIED_CONTAM: transcriptional regulator with XRE-family HTH domain [Streptomyces graminofaciens]
MPRPPDPADFPGTEAMYAFKMGLYEFLHGVHRKRLAGRMHMDPSTLSRVVNKNQRITEADLDRLIAAVRTSERTPTMQEVAYLRTLYVRAELEADRTAFRLRELRVEREQAVRRTIEREDLLDSTRKQLTELRSRYELILREGVWDEERAAKEAAAKLVPLEARVRELEQALAEAVASLIALEEKLAALEPTFPDLGDPTSTSALANDPLHAAQVLAAIPVESERIAKAGCVVPELSLPAGLLTFFTELLHRSGVETLMPVMEEALSTMPARDLAAVLVAASDSVAPVEEHFDEGWPTAEVRSLLHDLVHKQLEPRTFAAVIHLLAADDHDGIARAILTDGAQGPVHDVLRVSAALRELDAPYLQDATTTRHPEGIAELAGALRTENRDPDARFVLHTAGQRLRHSELAALADILRASCRIHDLRELQEGAALRDEG